MKKNAIMLSSVCLLIFFYAYTMQAIKVCSLKIINSNPTIILKFIESIDLNKSLVALKIERQKTSGNSIIYFSTPFSMPQNLGSFYCNTTSKDSNVFICDFTFPKTYNPFKQYKYYKNAVLLKQTFDTLTSQLIRTKDLTAKVYGLEIRFEKIKYDLFLSYKTNIKQNASINEIEIKYQKLKQYIKANMAQTLDNPMYSLNLIDNKYSIMIAYPIDKEIKENNIYKIKRMIKGNVLHGIIKGGTQTIRNAIVQMEVFMQDFNLSTPAIPFESFDENNRFKQDTTQWITHIYYPIY